MQKRSEATRVLVLEELPPDYILTRAEVAAAVALRIRRSVDDDRFARDRIRDRLKTPRKKAKHKIPCASPGKYTAVDVLKWARGIWSDDFSDIPIDGSMVAAISGVGTLAARAIAFPPDIDGCHRALLAADRRIASLEADLATALRQITELAPRAERYNANCLENKKNAEKPRAMMRRK